MPRPLAARRAGRNTLLLVAGLIAPGLAVAQTAGPGAATNDLTLDTINVTGQTGWGPVDGIVATQSVTGTKTDTPILDIPQTVNVVTADQIAEQGAQSVSQALRYTPGVYSEVYGASSQYDSYTRVRGFDPTFFLNGLRLPYGASSSGFVQPRIEPYGLERVEVLKGPTSGLYGQNGPGGMIAMVSKQPTATPLRSVEIETGSFDRLQGAFDFGGPIGPEGKMRYRLTGLARHSDTQVDYIEDNRTFIAPALSWVPDEDTSLTVFAQFQRESGGKNPFNYLPMSGTLLKNPNGELPWSRFSGEPDYDSYTRDQQAIGYAFETRLGAIWTLRQNLGYLTTDLDMSALNVAGLQPDQRTLDRFAVRVAGEASALAIDTNAEAEFVTGPLAHQLLAGFDYRDGDDTYNLGFGAGPSIDIFKPVYGAPVADPGLGFLRIRQDEEQLGLYLQDQVRWGDWLLTLGGRQDWADSSTDDRITGVTTKQDDSAFTGRVGVTRLIGDNASVYASYATSFQPLGGTDFSGTPFEPTKGKQYEVGAKYEPDSFPGLITVAAYHLTQENVLTPDPDPLHFGFDVQTGEVEVRGLELEGKVTPRPGLDLIASYTHADNKVTESNTPGQVGDRLPMTPVHQAAFWATYQVQSGALDGFGFGGGLRYVGETFGDPDNAWRMPSNTLVDARLSYDLGRASPALDGAALSVVATNLFDDYYATGCGGGDALSGTCTLGARRTIIATLAYDW